MRDSYTNDYLAIRSSRALEQMQYIVQEGSDIGPSAKGRKHDDFVFSLAFAHRAWLEWVRPDMIATNYSYERAQLDDARRISGDRPGFIAGVVGQWFDNKEKARLEVARDPWSVQRGFK